jgi:hypothetical protein
MCELLGKELYGPSSGVSNHSAPSGHVKPRRRYAPPSVIGEPMGSSHADNRPYGNDVSEMTSNALRSNCFQIRRALKPCRLGVKNFRCSEVGVSGLPLLPGDVPVAEAVGS